MKKSLGVNSNFILFENFDDYFIITQQGILTNPEWLSYYSAENGNLIIDLNNILLKT